MTQGRWAYRDADDWPSRIAHADAALDEVLLEGAINQAPPAAFVALLAEVRRVLRPGGRISVGGLVASQPLAPGARRVPGRDRDVRCLPTESEPLAQLARAGFVDVRLEHLAAAAAAVLGNAELRRLVASARQPGPAPDDAVHRVVYRGPFAAVVGDDGTVYHRGERTYVSTRQREQLLAGTAGADFLVLDPPDRKDCDPSTGCC